MKIDNKEVYGIIYLIRNKINNKIYVGQTTLKGGFDERYNKDLETNTHNDHLKRSINKYGIDNFEIDKEFDIAYSKEELDKLEDMYIKIYNTTHFKYGYNKMFGGSNGKLTEGTKEKLRKINLGKKQSKETITKRVLKLSGTGNYYYKKGYLLKGNLNPFFGRKHTYESKVKMSESHKGKSPWNKGLTMDSLKVINITTNKLFNSAKEGAVYYNINIQHIYNCCKGTRKSCGKLEDGTRLKWKYIKDLTPEEYIKYNIENKLKELHNQNLVQAC